MANIKTAKIAVLHIPHSSRQVPVEERQAIRLAASHRFISAAMRRPRFPERGTSLFSERHLAGFRNNLRRPVIPNAAVMWMCCILHSHCFIPLA